jgi:UDP-glucose 4-epimerase
LGRFVYASSSSVYGLTPTLPMTEDSLLHPLSPYGVTKLAAEQLCFLYFQNYGVPTVSLRFFTVYGPGQRPDMAFHKFFQAIGGNRPIHLYGSGEQTRDFTFVEDIVEACLSASRQGRAGEVYNVGGGHRERMNDILPVLEETCGKKVDIVREEKQKGDVAHTHADIRKAQLDLAYRPRTELRAAAASGSGSGAVSNRMNEVEKNRHEQNLPDSHLRPSLRVGCLELQRETGGDRPGDRGFRRGLI